MADTDTDRQSGWTTQTQTVGMEDTVSQDGRHRHSQDGRHSWDGRHRNRHTVGMEDTDIVRTEDTNTDSQDRRHRHRQSGQKTQAQTDSQDSRHRETVKIEDTDKRSG